MATGSPSDHDVSRLSAFNAAIKRTEALIDVEKYDHALAEAGKALTHGPNSEYAHYLAGFCHFHLSHYKEAQSEAREAIQLEPDYAPAYWLIANIALQQSHYRKGLQAIEQALMLASEEPPYLMTKAALLLDSGKSEQALDVAETALRYDPEYEPAQHVRTLALTNLGKVSEADASAVRALRQSPDSSLAWFERGQQLFLQGRTDESRDAYLESLRIDPEDTDAQEGLMRVVSIRHPFFALFWRWTIFLMRFPPTTRTAFLIGLFIGVRILKEVAAAVPASQPIILPILGLYLLFCIYTWAAMPLFRYAIGKGWIK